MDIPTPGENNDDLGLNIPGFLEKESKKETITQTWGNINKERKASINKYTGRGYIDPSKFKNSISNRSSSLRFKGISPDDQFEIPELNVRFD